MLWGSNGAASNNSPTHSSEHYKANATNQTAAFMNTTPSAFVNNQVFGVYGVTNVQVQAAESNASHKTLNLTPGWYTVKQGMGPAITFHITAPGSGYSNNDKFVVTSTIADTVNVSTSVSTNASGAVINVGSLGGLFVNLSSATVGIVNTSGGTANGTGFTATVGLGGRAGRIQRECLISLGSMTSNSTFANNPLFPAI